MNQLGLFDETMFLKWRTFHTDNPQVFDLFRRFATQARDAGRARFSARMIAERMRWYSHFETTDQEFKLNNNYIPYYARLLVGLDSSFEGFLEMRSSRFDSTVAEVVAAHPKA